MPEYRTDEISATLPRGLGVSIHYQKQGGGCMEVPYILNLESAKVHAT